MLAIPESGGSLEQRERAINAKANAHFATQDWADRNPQSKADHLSEVSADVLRCALDRGSIDFESIVLAGEFIDLELLSFERNRFIQHLGPDLFLYSLFSFKHLNRLYIYNKEWLGAQIWEDNRKLHSELVIFSLSQGANVNFNPWGEPLFELARKHGAFELALFLLNKGAQLAAPNLTAFINAGLEPLIDNPSHALELQYRALSAPRNTEAKIPFILHHIWFTHPDDPGEIANADIENIIANHAVFMQDSDAQWTHIVWANDPSLIPGSFNRLRRAGIEVRSLESVKDDLLMYDRIVSFIADKRWGMASDTARLSLIELLGGVYADHNFGFERTLTDELHRYDFFAHEHYGLTRVMCNCFAAKAHHPILLRALELIEHNIIAPPLCIATMAYPNTAEGIERITFDTTGFVLGLAYYAKAHQEGTIDVLYPYLTSPCGYLHIEPETASPYEGPDLEHYNKAWGQEKRYYDFIDYIIHHNINGACALYFGDDNVSSEATWKSKY